MSLREQINAVERSLSELRRNYREARDTLLRLEQAVYQAKTLCRRNELVERTKFCEEITQELEVIK